MSRHAESVGLKFLMDQATWFSLRNYDAIEAAPLELWFRQFALRIDLRTLKSMLIHPDPKVAEMYRAVLGTLFTHIRTHPVIIDRHLPFFLEQEELLWPAAFSVFRSIPTNGMHVRIMTLNDLIRVAPLIKNRSLEAANSIRVIGHRHGDHNPRMARNTPNVLDENVTWHLQGAEPTEAFLRVDLRLPVPVVHKQLRGLLDQLAIDAAPFLSRTTAKRKAREDEPKREMKLQPSSWFKSRVLAYIDLCHWLEELPQQDLPEITSADFAKLLGIGDKQLTQTTARYANVFGDPLSWEFMQLSEAVARARRPAPNLIRKPNRHKRTVERKNAEKDTD